MEQRTNLSNQIDAANPKAMLDMNAKNLLADKQVLARILKYSLFECKSMNIQQLVESIEGDILVSKIPIEPGLTNQKITGDATESAIPGEGVIYFDMRFHIYLQSRLCKILLNVEVQKSSDAGSLGYHIENRMEFYLARMLSAQKETEFINSNYDDLKRVKSIWICMDSKIDRITRYTFLPKVIYGEKEKTDRRFLMEGILIQIRTGGTFEVSENKLIQMLEELFGKDSSEVKKRKLEEQGLIITQTLEGRMQDMCNYSELIEKRGIEQGVEQGKESTIIELIEKGLLTVQQGAEQLQISLGELEKIAKKYNASIS